MVEELDKLAIQFSREASYVKAIHDRVRESLEAEGSTIAESQISIEKNGPDIRYDL